jgi:hypothetical protein
VPTRSPAELRREDEPNGRDDHDGPEHGLGEVVEDGGEHEEREGGKTCRHDRGQATLGAGAVVHRCLRQAAAGRIGAKDPTRDVGCAEGDELAVRVEWGVASAPERAGRRDRLREPDQGNPERGR